MNPYDHFRAPLNVSELDMACHFCGEAIVAGETVIDMPEFEEWAHGPCADAAIEDQREAA